MAALVAFLVLFGLLGHNPSPAMAADDTHGREVLKQLTAMQSATEFGLSFNEYSRRLLDLKVSLDQEFEAWSSPANLGAKADLLGAMRLYTMAHSIWQGLVSKKLLYPPPEMGELCQLWDPSWANLPTNHADVKMLWKCASMKIKSAKDQLR